MLIDDVFSNRNFELVYNQIEDARKFVLSRVNQNPTQPLYYATERRRHAVRLPIKPRSEIAEFNGRV